MFDRRDFLQTSAVLAAGALLPRIAVGAYTRPQGRLKVGVIGCGGRGTGAAVNALQASTDTEVTALADVFPDRLASCRKHLTTPSQDFDASLVSRVKLTDDRCFSGFDAYKQLVATDVDLVVLATPPHFRPIHLAAAIDKGKHVFMEKPVAVDPAGVRSVIASGELADRKKLCIVTGTQRRHETCYLEAMKRIHDGALGKPMAGYVFWNQGGLWKVDRKPDVSDMEWQLRNWLYFTWLSGDHIVEQHVHNLDVANWVMGGPPIKALGMGGRQVRTSPDYGHIFDHFAIEYEYPGGVTITSMCRQIDNCASRVAEVFQFRDGISRTTSGSARLQGGTDWTFDGRQTDPYVQEHKDLIEAITSGKRLNEARQIAESTLTAIMGRMSAYTGKEVTWEQALNSKLDLAPASYAMGPMPMPEVAVPGKTPLI